MKDLNFYYALLIYISKYAWVIPSKDKKAKVQLMHFRKYQMIQKESQIKYGQTEEVNFLIILLKNGYKIIILQCIQKIMKENLLLPKDLFEH